MAPHAPLQFTDQLFLFQKAETLPDFLIYMVPVTEIMILFAAFSQFFEHFLRVSAATVAVAQNDAFRQVIMFFQVGSHLFHGLLSVQSGYYMQTCQDSAFPGLFHTCCSLEPVHLHLAFLRMLFLQHHTVAFHIQILRCRLRLRIRFCLFGLHFFILSILRPNSFDHFPYQLRTDAYRSQRVHSPWLLPDIRCLTQPFATEYKEQRGIALIWDKSQMSVQRIICFSPRFSDKVSGE